jgi:hypothetical protein
MMTPPPIPPRPAKKPPKAPIRGKIHQSMMTRSITFLKII